MKHLNNISKRLLWSLVGIILAAGLVWLVQQSLTGTATTVGDGIVNESDIVGTWVENKDGMDVLGGKYAQEVFLADGSWQKGNAEGPMKKGRWKIEGKSIAISVMFVEMGATSEALSEILTYDIVSWSRDKMVVRCAGKETILWKMEHVK